MRYSCSKEVDQLVRRSLHQRWTNRRARTHGLLSPPSCSLFVTAPGTPSDWRTLANLQRDIDRVERLALGGRMGRVDPASSGAGPQCSTVRIAASNQDDLISATGRELSDARVNCLPVSCRPRQGER